MNDFQDSFAYIDYKEWGELKVWDASWAQVVDRIQGGTIAVFLNFKKVGEYESKQEALQVVLRLLKEAPNSFFEENKEVLLKGLVPGSYSGNTRLS